ncbi:type II toxin-antitoxin system death-on-curing family toxin [Patescibacteria group bacterium]
MPRKSTQLSVEEVKLIAHKLARLHLTFNEPIPDFSTRFPGKLESCLATPFQKYSKKSLYQGLTKKAAVMFYLMVKNHPFQNGNKRIAMTSVFVLLHKNDKWLKVDTKELYNFALWVAESNSKLKDEVIAATEKFLNSYIVDL